MGQNPTGGRLPASRYQEIYDVCREFGVAIIEDDPYYYLQHDGVEAGIYLRAF